MSDRTTLVSLLKERVSCQPDRIAYTFLANGETPEDSLTYRQLEGQARAIASHLQSRISPGERALLIYPQGLDFLAAFFGCLYAGVIAIPAPAPEASRLKRSLPRLRAIIDDAGAIAILTKSSLLSQIETTVAQLAGDLSISWYATDTVADSLAEKWIETEINRSTLAYLQYTSGSTSSPKGVMLSHGNLIHHLADQQLACGYDSESVTVTWMPYFHDYGLVEGILQPLYNGTPAYLMSPIAFIKRPIRWLQAISDYRATHSQAPNFAYAYCAEKITSEQRKTLDLSCWQASGNAAEPINPKAIDEFCATFKSCGFRPQSFAPAYGLAEATLLVTTSGKTEKPVFCQVSPQELAQNRIVSSATGQRLVGSGRLLPNTQVEIVRPETLTRCPAGEVGEIWVANQGVAQGYWQRPNVTQETFQAYLADTGEGPFLRTGDLGFIKDGELFVTGRRKDLIIIRGQNYYPQDIEWTVEKSHPGLHHGCCAAFSVEVDGVEQVAIAAEVESCFREKLNGDELFGSIRTAVAEYHELPVHGVVLLKAGSIPKTSSGKIQRHACRAKFFEGSLDSLATWTLDKASTTPSATPQNEYEFRLMQIWQKTLEVKQVGVRDNFFELGGNSIKAAEIIAGVEAMFGESLPLSAFMENPTIAQFARCLSQPEWADNERSLVAIKPQGKKRPFFYVHPRSGSILMAANLARYIDAERPFYGLQSVGLNGKQQPYNKIEDMAAHYIREIQTVQPTGPYLLGGRCFGGRVALEMAQQLLTKGEKVSILAIVEAGSPQIGEPLSSEEQEMINQLNPIKAQGFLKVRESNDLAMRKYKTSVYPGQIDYFLGEQTETGQGSYPMRQGGWVELAGGGLVVHEIPGDHMTITQEPNVQVLAAKLSQRLDEAEKPSFLPRLPEFKVELERSRQLLISIQARLKPFSQLSPKTPNTNHQIVPDLAFITCIEAGYLEAQSLLLYESIRRYGGRFSQCPIYAVSPRAGRAPSPQTKQRLEQLSVEYIDRVLNSELDFFSLANKSLACAYIEENQSHEILVWLDSDTLLFREPSKFWLPDYIDVAVRPINRKRNTTSGANDPFDDYWRKMCQACDVDYDSIPFLETFVDRCIIKACYNGGLVVVRPEKGIFRRWIENLKRGVRLGFVPRIDRCWVDDQPALSLAIWGATERAQILEPVYNYNIQAIDVEPQQAKFYSSLPLVHIHYHQMFSANRLSKNPLLQPNFIWEDNLKQWLMQYIPLSVND
jgi:acyl-CoA synthetase (AMP-forming)/AMP-acid ligase II/thioesterase domain-containing protein/acyl carrier protein